MFEFIFHIPGLAAIKDLDSIYQGITSDLANIVGWKDSEQSIGKTDHDLPCKASESADIFIAQDKKVIEKQSSLISLEILQYADSWRIIMGEIRLIKNENSEVIALFSHGIDCSKNHLIKNYWTLHQIDKKFLMMMPQITF